jgi:hypothetical protein
MNSFATKPTTIAVMALCVGALVMTWAMRRPPPPATAANKAALQAQAAKAYQTLADEYPSDPNAATAAARANLLRKQP